MTNRLPARPNLEHLKTQAKSLLAQIKNDNKNARLADAQFAVAKRNGFASWPILVRHVDLLRQLEGTWEFLDLEVDGSAMPAAALENSRMLIDGDRFRMESPDATYEGIITIDVEKQPHHINIEFIEGPEAGNWSYGIFELDGDRFKICLGLTGATRPEGFFTSPNSGHALENLRRILKTRPSNVKGGKRQPASPTVEPAQNAAGFEFVPTPLLERLAGEWAPTQLVSNGQPMQEMFLSMGSRTFKENETKVVFGGQTMVHAKVRLDESASPIAVDYLSIGRGAGQLTFGILEWIGDEVRVCMSAPGSPRPQDFSCEPASGRTLSQWKRK